MSEGGAELPVLHPKDLDLQRDDQQWLIRSLWGRAAVGIVGGAPKCCKTFFGLDMAVSVASGTKALGHFEVEDHGAVLVYLAEDGLPMVRQRIESLCRRRLLDLAGLDLKVITAPTLRLDLKSDQDRLRATVRRLRPRMLLLDPLVRLHRLDENSATEISGLLGYLREIQRTFDVAVVLVHHASKRHRSEPGQALRGSGDLHAFGDSNAYLVRNGNHLVLTIEHRAARAPDPLLLELVAGPNGEGVHLEIKPSGNEPDPARVLAAAIVVLLKESGTPIPRNQLRDQLRVKNERLGEVLLDLERRGRIQRSDAGWLAAPGV